MSDIKEKNEKELKGKHLSLLFKIIGAVFTITLIVVKLVLTLDLTFGYVVASVTAGLGIANMFISIDISFWIQNLNKAKELLADTKIVGEKDVK